MTSTTREIRRTTAASPRAAPRAKSPLLDIRLLGDCALSFGAAPLTAIHSPRVQSLLAFLVLHRAAPQSRRHLAFTFWPDSSEQQARTNLRFLLHALRAALPGADRFVHSDTLTVQWLPGAPFRLDVAEFERACARASSLADWQAAVDAYGGELLPGGYDDWILVERERLQRTFVQALTRLAQLLEDERDTVAALRHAQRLVQCEPLSEDPYRRLMRLHALNGDRAGVVRIYHTCARVLKLELAIEPSAATRQAYEQALAMAPLPEPAPPARQETRAPARDNLPSPPTRFIGRAQERERLRRLISANRLVTLTGAGGVGKTRLAQAVAADLREAFPDGAWWVDLSALNDPSLLPQQVLAALRIGEQAARPPMQTLLDSLRDKRLLLVLDNCEHLAGGRDASSIPRRSAQSESVCAGGRDASSIPRRSAQSESVCAGGRDASTNPRRGRTVPPVRDAQVEGTGAGAVAALAADLLQATGSVHILATSREPLHVVGELTWRVPSLALAAERPDGLADLARAESVQLFVDRAALALPTFELNAGNAEAVAAVCARLDGIPLAIELAAARVGQMPVEQIVQRLDDGLHLLSTRNSSVRPRHRTLRGTMDWSCRLLPAGEQLLFRRLSVFAGGFTLEAAEAVCSGPGLFAPDTAARTTGGRAPSGPGLSAPDTAARTTGGHAPSGPGLPAPDTAARTTGGHAPSGPGLSAPDTAARTTGGRAPSGDAAAGHGRDAGPALPPAEIVSLLSALHDKSLVEVQYRRGETRYFLLEIVRQYAHAQLRASGELERVRARHFEFCLGLARQAHPTLWTLRQPAWLQRLAADHDNLRAALEWSAAGAASAPRGLQLAVLLEFFWIQQWYAAEARVWLERLLAHAGAAASPALRAKALFALARTANFQEQWAQARTFAEQSLALSRESGDVTATADALYFLGVLCGSGDECSAARVYLEESLSMYRRLENQDGIGMALPFLGWVNYRSGDRQLGRTQVEQAVQLTKEHGVHLGYARALSFLGDFARWEGDSERAESLYWDALGVFPEPVPWIAAQFLTRIALLAAGAGQFARAARLFGAVARMRAQPGSIYTLQERAETERALPPVRAALAEQFEAAWAAGWAMNVDAAFAYARQTLVPR